MRPSGNKCKFYFAKNKLVTPYIFQNEEKILQDKINNNQVGFFGKRFLFCHCSWCYQLNTIKMSLASHIFLPFKNPGKHC